MVHKLIEFGVSLFYEVGTDDTLQKIVSRMYPDIDVQTILDIPDYNGVIKNYSIE